MEEGGLYLPRYVRKGIQANAKCPISSWNVQGTPVFFERMEAVTGG